MDQYEHFGLQPRLLLGRIAVFLWDLGTEEIKQDREARHDKVAGK
jgi:hypothetical protein